MWGRVSTLWKRLLKPVLTVLAMVAVAFSMLKVTNDPQLGNMWLFYTPAERQAVIWSDQKISNNAIWTGVNDNLLNVMVFWEGYTWIPQNTWIRDMTSTGCW